MLKIITTLTLFLFGIVAKGQDVESRAVSVFSQVEVKNGIELIYTESKIPSLQIENLSLSKNIITEVKGKKLIIYNAKNLNSKPIKVYLSAENLVSFEANSNAKITITNAVNAKDMKIILKNGAQFSGAIKTTRKTNLIAQSGATFNGRIESNSVVGNFKNNSKINITGKAKIAKFQTADVALVNAKNFIANRITLNATGKSLALIHADQKIAINVADEAKVTYTGYPENLAMNEDAEAFKKFNSKQSLSFNY